MYKVVVLMSTYNGEKYLQEQIESLLKQENVDLQILVRDDGSSDRTLDILQMYSKKYDCFSFYKNENLGPAKSFLDLVANAPTADFYAFCDQDDVWDSCKLTKAIEQLLKFDDNKPNLYYSNLRIVSSDLTFCRMSHKSIRYNTNKYSALIENLCTGCTAVFNYTAKKMISEHIPEKCTMHDTWIYIMCKMLGNTIYDPNAYISYRQHASNVVGTSLNRYSFSIIKNRILRIFERGLQPRLTNAVNFEKCFVPLLDEYSKYKVHKIVCYKKSLKNRLSLLFDKDLNATTLYGKIRFKVHVLWGTV